MKWLNALYALLVLAVLGLMIWLGKKVFDFINPSGTIGWWRNFFSGGKKGEATPDLTGTLGEAVSNYSEQAAMDSATPQLSYDRARSAYMKARGLSAAWGDAKGAGWPWDNWQQWSQAGMPAFPK